MTGTATNRLAEYYLSGSVPRLVAIFATVRQPDAGDPRCRPRLRDRHAGGKLRILPA